MGMTYDEYWNGSASLVKYYVDAALLKKELANEMAWIQGKYVYDAIMSLWTLLNGMQAKPKPEPYVKEPYPITMKEARRRKAIEEVRQRKEQQANLIANLSAVFKASEKKKQQEGDGPQDA